MAAFLYLAATTRPDKAFAVILLSQACKSPTVQDFNAGKRVLRKLKGRKYSLTYSRHDNGLGLFAYSDANRADNVKTRNFVLGMVFKLFWSDSTIIWRTAKQRWVSLQSCESEYMVLSALAQEVSFLKQVSESINSNTAIYSNSKLCSSCNSFKIEGQTE